MLNKIKKLPKDILPYLIIAICIVLACLSLISYRTAASTGSALGASTGTLAGRAIGSLQGITVGREKGYEAGKNQGLSAEDTVVELSSKLQEVEKLEVLVASGTYSDYLEVHKDYAAVISQKYNAVFTVDLAGADIELKNDELHIILDEPELEFIPVGEILKISEYQKNGFTGNAEDGYTALNNSADQIRAKAAEELRSDKGLMRSAKDATKTQLTSLVNAVSLTKPNVIIEYRPIKGGSANE